MLKAVFNYLLPTITHVKGRYFKYIKFQKLRFFQISTNKIFWNMNQMFLVCPFVSMFREKMTKWILVNFYISASGMNILILFIFNTIRLSEVVFIYVTFRFSKKMLKNRFFNWKVVLTCMTIYTIYSGQPFMCKMVN